MFRTLLSTTTDREPSALRLIAIFESVSDPSHIPELPNSNRFVDDQLKRFTEARKQKKGLVPQTLQCHLDSRSFVDKVFIADSGRGLSAETGIGIQI
jgi:hypothetical protein